MKATILWLEGKRAESPHFVPGLRKKGYQVETVSSGAEALARFSAVAPNLVVLNAASMRTSGKRICRSLRELSNGVPIVIISNAEKADNEAHDANVVLYLPFTTRKLLNRISPFLPVEAEDMLSAGPIQLFLDRKLVSCQGRETKLTPRLSNLLKIFLEHPGEALEREQLFRQVWSTEYTVDTRTLDVHISWLRQALEEDPHKPVLLKTIRGLGYRLDVAGLEQG